MSDKKLFIVKTYIDKKDYHKFLYIATFFRRKFMIPILLVVSAIMGYFVAINKEVFSWREFFVYWILLLLITLFAIVVKIETRNREKRKEDKKSGIFSACETLEFFDDFIVIKSTAYESKSKVKYNKFYEILETKDYFIIYFNRQQASIIRKFDLDKENIGKLQNLFSKKLSSRYRKIY